MAKNSGHARSAITGKYVTMTYAKSHPELSENNDLLIKI